MVASCVRRPHATMGASAKARHPMRSSSSLLLVGAVLVFGALALGVHAVRSDDGSSSHFGAKSSSPSAQQQPLLLDADDAYAEGDEWRSGFVEFSYHALGWTAFAAWSLSFYPQVYENWSTNSVEGLSFDFVAFNFIKHSSYGTYNVVLYFSKSVQSLYRKHFDTHTIPVALNDVVFSIHAVALVIVQLCQLNIHERGDQRISFVAMMILACAVLFILVTLCIALSGKSAFGMTGWLGFIFGMNNLQLVMTFIKYSPQAYYNWKRKSTEGWSVHGVALDLLGGVCNLVQLLLLCWNNHDLSPLVGDAGKLGLSVETLVFDLLFIFQHMVLYKRTRNLRQYEPVFSSPSKVL